MFTHGPHRDHRSRTCKGCRFWSEMVAMSGPETGGVLKAMCLKLEGPQRGQYMAAREACGGWRIGHLGAVDEPGSQGDEYQVAAKVSQAISDDDKCSDCVHCTTVEHPSEIRGTCAEGWPGDVDEDGYIVSCVMFVLRGSARDTSGGAA